MTSHSLCAGVAPLTARLEPGQARILEQPAVLSDLLDQYGSPLNLIDTGPMARNLAELTAAAEGAGVGFRAFFARKANKAIGFVDRALELGAGVDVSSEAELHQTLERGAGADAVVVTAAIKPRALLELCAHSGVLTVIDNEDELIGLSELTDPGAEPLPVALRLALTAAAPGSPPTRFGLLPGELADLARRAWSRGGPARDRLRLDGLHFHVDGYAAEDRARGLTQAIELVDLLRGEGHALRFIDIGGGIPMRYLEDREEWQRFWSRHHDALEKRTSPLTYLGHSLGLREGDGSKPGQASVYPGAQELVRGAWLAQILAAHGPAGSETLGQALTDRGLELRCEPGRALADGCGMTLARVEMRKRNAAGEWMIGLAMNRTQWRTGADDAMVDPVLVRGSGPGRPTRSIEGYLVGAYCIERELLSWRRFRFPAGVAVGDVMAFPNTAGYYMHILESSSHQMPLARNLLVDADRVLGLDPIETLG